jgi:SAM-dependent methyltransferase
MLMSRVGATVTPGEFVQGVIEIFHEVSDYSEATMHFRFRQSRAYRDFLTLLARAGPPAGSRILAIGCGPGFGGRGSGFAASVVQELYAGAHGFQVERMEVTPQLLDPSEKAMKPVRRFPLVVTHSVLHYLFELKPFCRLLHSLIEPGGRYVMANEPNARFWDNTECVETLRRKERSDRRRKRAARFLDPRRYGAKLLRLLGPSRPADAFAVMNHRLRERFHLRGELTPSEIMHINEPHLPDPGSDSPTLRLGSNGLDWERLKEVFPPLRLEVVRTSGYLGRENLDRIESKWREADRDLAGRCPLHGSSFTALWWKPAA